MTVLRRGARAAAVACLAAALAGCATARSWNAGCPGPYSGLRYYRSSVAELPWDGVVFFALDSPFSLLADTLLLPASVFVEPEKPRRGWVTGCRWVEDGARR